jgi:hypothetical protein
VQGQYGCLNFHVKCGGQQAKLTVVMKNKWSGGWTQVWFYCKVPLLWSPSLGRGKGIYAIHSYMMGLDFTMEPPFECPDDDGSDMAFVKVTHTIGGRDVVEEFMAYELFPLLVSFSLDEITEGETSVSKLAVPMPTFPIVKLPEETNDSFVGRVELAAANVIGRYPRREHDVCIMTVPNEGQVNRVFEQDSVPYRPRLEPRSEANKEAAQMWKSDTGAAPMGKRAKVSGQKVVPSKAHVASKSAGVISLKIALMKVGLAKSVLKTTVAPGASVLKPRAPLGTAVSKIATTVTAQKAGVLKISTGAKRPAAATSLAVKGKQERTDVGPPPPLVWFWCGHRLW